MDDLIGLVAVLVTFSIPITAIITSHMRKKEKIKLQYIDKEIKLEELRLQNYKNETDKLKLELEHSKTLLLEENNNRN